MPACEPKKRGPRTPEGKAKSALNALRHGLRARHFALLPHEDPAEFEALATATREAYRPACAVERELVEALAVALWREIRADRMEAEVLADIPPADASRTCGSDLTEERHRASLALLLRYRAQAAGAVRRAQEALLRHRALRAAAADAPDHCTNEFPKAAPAEDPLPPADPLPEAAAPPPRLDLREAVRRARNPLDTPLLRALGRDPELVLPVPGLPPEAWPWAQAKADPLGRPIAGQGPYRRVPHLPPDQWLAHQPWLAVMDKVAARAGAEGGPGDHAGDRRAASPPDGTSGSVARAA